jgi:hypothetical protein
MRGAISLSSSSHWRSVLRQNDVGLKRQKLLCGTLPLVCIVERSPASIDAEVPTFDPPELLKPFPECAQVILKFWITLFAQPSWGRGYDYCRLHCNRRPDRFGHFRFRGSFLRQVQIMTSGRWSAPAVRSDQQNNP